MKNLPQKRWIAHFTFNRRLEIVYVICICLTITVCNGWTLRCSWRTKILQSESLLILFESPSADNELIRLQMLHDKLILLGIDPKNLHTSAIQSIHDPSSGYDPEFGKSAIKTYRSYLTSSTTYGTSQSMDIQFQASASRCAQQIDFLIKRHRSSEADWVRHLDKSMTATTLTSATTATSTLDRKVFPLILVLDHLRSAFNVGSLFRTADATGCSLVITIGITPHPGGGGQEKVSKSALGAERVVPHTHFPTMSDAIDFLRTEKPNYCLIAMETTERSKSYTTLTYPKSGCALILGNEVTGTFGLIALKKKSFFPSLAIEIN
jgi:tRNA G18 (ribose-2'-O)-methylase SpoU